MTTEPKHTPEPWPLDGDADNAPDMTFAGNYERARDCVNACAGLPDIELHGATEQGGVKAVLNRLLADNERLREALREITEGKGAFSMDPLTHAENTIEDMKALARAALSATERKE